MYESITSNQPTGIASHGGFCVVKASNIMRKFISWWASIHSGQGPPCRGQNHHSITVHPNKRMWRRFQSSRHIHILVTRVFSKVIKVHVQSAEFGAPSELDAYKDQVECPLVEHALQLNSLRLPMNIMMLLEARIIDKNTCLSVLF